ncbi:hypothetical protein RhiirA4_454643 [Rhizophagus irregularis]|uniref:Uncharacterized protein n=1 Tax=Rhizophagus irregularis TaxID=588596 RepID=A0A2I1G3G9_9GLOM|nr:hypothetical protein RhiirA4_454643 [Rhizophagus irregularis]
MIPAIEYHLQAVVLMERECENILAKVNKIVKHNCNLPIGYPNAIIYDKDTLKMNMINLQNTYWTAKCVGESKNVNLKRIKSLEHDKEYLMKWHHFCVENGFNKCGGEPLWYKRLKQLVCIEETREIKDKYKINKAEQKSIDYLKENDTVSKKSNRLITWNETDSEVYDDNDSPWLKKCTGCSKNISRNKDDDICLIHCNIGDGLNKNNILINNKDKEINEFKRTGMEDIEEMDFLIWLDHICTNKKNFIWENFNALVSNWKDIDKLTITAASIFFKYN